MGTAQFSVEKVPASFRASAEEVSPVSVRAVKVVPDYAGYAFPRDNLMYM